MKIAVYCGSTAGNREAFTIGAVALGVCRAAGRTGDADEDLGCHCAGAAWDRWKAMCTL